MKRWLPPLIIVALLVLLVGAAFVWDCARIEHHLRQGLVQNASEVQKHEARLIEAMQSVPRVPATWAEAVLRYQNAVDRPDRMAAYPALEAAAQVAIAAELDPTDPTARRVKDEVAGAMNRRARAMPVYEKSQREYEEWQKSFRGAVGRRFAGSD